MAQAGREGAQDLAARPRTLFEKIWDDHVVLALETGATLLYVDRHLIHEGSATAFERLKDDGLEVAERSQILGTADHYVPTTHADKDRFDNPEILHMVQ